MPTLATCRGIALLLCWALAWPAQGQSHGCSRSEPGWRCPDAFTVVQQAENPFTFGSPGYGGGGNALLQAYAGTHSAAYQYAVYYGVGNTTGRIRRPVVVVDGIDVGFSFGNGRSADEIYNTLLNRDNVTAGSGPPVNVRLGADVLADGYDLVILDYGDALDFIERNALALVHLLTRVNAQLVPGEQIQAVVGPSLGALVARYALVYMEANDIPHNVSLYVSFDGAHQGGHIPVGIQQFADDIVHHSDFGQFYPLSFTEQVDAVFRSPAVRELLVFNAFAADYTQTPAHPYFRQDPLRTGLLNGLLALGDYPSEPRKLAIVNGSPTALSQLVGCGSPNRVAPGDVQLDFDAYWTYGIGGFRSRMESFAAAPTVGSIYRRRDYTCSLFCFPNGIPENPSPFNAAPWTTSDTGPLDSAPGGFRDTGRSLAAPFTTVYSWADAVDRVVTFDLGALVEPAMYFTRQLLANGNVHIALAAPTPNHSFVSTLSALDYNTTLSSRSSLVQSTFAGQNLFRNVLTDVQAGVASARTPFDGFYLAGDDGIEGRENQAHIALTPGISAYVRGELARTSPVTREYTQSTTVPGDILPAGSTVFVDDYVTVTYSGPVSASPGVTFNLGRDAKVTFQARASIVGSKASPVRFVRWTRSKYESRSAPWNRVTLFGDNSRFEHVDFIGGYKSVDIAARGVLLRDVRSVGGWRGISTYFTPGGTRSEVTLDRLTIVGSSSVGMVLDHAEAFLSQSSIQTSAEAGLWIRDSRVRVTNTRIESNGRMDTSRDGLEAFSGAEVLIDNGARNTIRTNGRFEVSAFYGSRIYAGECQAIDALTLVHDDADYSDASPTCVGGGYNDIEDLRGGQLVLNASGQVLRAQMNYWGGLPNPQQFAGVVSYHPFLISQPAFDAEHEAGQPEFTAVINEQPVENEGDSSTALFRHRHDPEVSRAAWIASIATMEQAASDGDELSSLALIAEAVATGEYGRARMLVARAESYQLSDAATMDISLAKVTLLEQAGQANEARRLLDELQPFLPENLFATLHATLSDSEGPLAPSTPAALTGLASQLTSAVVFPNPTRGDAGLALTLETDATCLVEIYASDGRQVASLAVSPPSRGRHVIRLPTAGLAAGLYAARVHCLDGVSGELPVRFVVTR